ncbi:MAG: radical SAM protein [Desulfovibrionaceae bacterium]
MASEPRSVCPVCLRPVPAHYEQHGHEVFLVKECPEHGHFSCVAWRGEPGFRQWSRPKTPSFPKSPGTPVERGCPLDCGLCAAHGQHTCTALIEITWRCDLSCAFCFASAGGPVRPDMDEPHVARLLEGVMAVSGPCNIQFSGGEPGLHPELPAFISRAKAMGFPFVQLNTNGLRAAREDGFAESLAAAGLDSVFLQFDSTEDAAFQRLRGRPLLAEKLRAVRSFVRAGIGVVLVPTVVPGVNDHDLGGLLRLAASLSPGVRGLHFQPVSYFGRFPARPRDDQRITLPEIMAGLEEQTRGEVRASDFLPPGCEHSRCSFHANYLVEEDGSLKRVSARNAACSCVSSSGQPPIVASEGANKAKAFVSRQWAAPPSITLPMTGAAPADDLDRFLARAATHMLAVSGMAFQDAWNLDLERLRGCCIHVAAPDGRLIPFCAYNLTAMDGTPLYRDTSHV